MPGDRTEQATQHRRDKARKEGDVLHSRELSSAAGTLVGVVVLGAVGGRALEAWRDRYVDFLKLGAPGCWEPSALATTLMALRRLATSLLWPSAAVMAAVFCGVLGAGVLQAGGISIYPGAVAFKLDRINPLSNVKNLFSLRAAARLGKSLLPASLLAVFAFQRIARELALPPFSLNRLEMLGSDVYGLPSQHHDSLSGSFFSSEMSGIMTGEMVRTVRQFVLAGILVAIGLCFAGASGRCQKSTGNSSLPVRSRARIGSEDPAARIREIDDPNTGVHWELIRDPRHPGGPGLITQLPGKNDSEGKRVKEGASRLGTVILRLGTRTSRMYFPRSISLPTACQAR